MAEDRLNLMKAFEGFLRNEYGIGFEDIAKLSKRDQVPVSVFNAKLGSLESIVKYLHENEGWKFVKIAKAIGRNHRAISATYRKAKQKLRREFKVGPTKFYLPLSVLKQELGVLEAVSLYLKEHYNLNYKEVAVLLHRDERTVWTAVNKARRKLGK